MNAFNLKIALLSTRKLSSNMLYVKQSFRYYMSNLHRKESPCIHSIPYARRSRIFNSIELIKKHNKEKISQNQSLSRSLFLKNLNEYNFTELQFFFFFFNAKCICRFLNSICWVIITAVND